MSVIHTIWAFLTRWRRQPASSEATTATEQFPTREINTIPARRPPARSVRTASTRRTWENPTGAASTSTRSADDDWPSPIVLADQLPFAAAEPTHQHHCPAPAHHENTSNHTSSQSSACDSDDYNRNTSSGTPDYGGSTDTGSSPD